MRSNRPPAGEDQSLGAQVIVLARSYQRLNAVVQDLSHTAPAIRPLHVLILLPLIVPLVVAILLGLLGWFVAWLATVAGLVTAIIFGDCARALRRRGGRALDRQPVG